MAKVAATLLIVMLLAPTTPLTLAVSVAPPDNGLAVPEQMSANASCRITDEAPKLNGLPKGTIFAPLDIGPTILLKSHHAVTATGHHRAEEAMADTIAAFTANPERARTMIADREIDYIVVCANLAEANLYSHEAPQGLMAQLQARKFPAWLEPVDLGGSDDFLVFRVRD